MKIMGQKRDDETAGEGWILTLMHGRYLGDIPFAHVAVKYACSSKTCEERDGARQGGNDVVQGDEKT